MKAYNLLLGNRETVIEDCETLVAMLEDTAALDTKILRFFASLGIDGYPSFVIEY